MAHLIIVILAISDFDNSGFVYDSICDKWERTVSIWQWRFPEFPKKSDEKKKKNKTLFPVNLSTKVEVVFYKFIPKIPIIANATCKTKIVVGSIAFGFLRI
jgi:hypothetical protein